MHDGWKDFTEERVIPYVEGHELPVMHDVIKQITCFVVCREFRHYELSRGLVVDDVRSEMRGEHVIQLSANRAKQTSLS